MTRACFKLEILALTLAGCAAHVPSLTPEAFHVRAIADAQVSSCTYLKDVDYTARLRGMGKSWEEVHQAGENGLRNMVASVGGNAYLNTRMEAESFSGRIHYSGQAYKCPPPGPGTLSPGAPSGIP